MARLDPREGFDALNDGGKTNRCAKRWFPSVARSFVVLPTVSKIKHSHLRTVVEAQHG